MWVGDCLKYLKRGWNRKEGTGNKDLKNGGKLDQGMGALKRGGWNPLPSYVVFLIIQLIIFAELLLDHYLILFVDSK